MLSLNFGYCISKNYVTHCIFTTTSSNPRITQNTKVETLIMAKYVYVWVRAWAAVA